VNIHVVIALLVKKLPEAFELTNPTEQGKKKVSSWIHAGINSNENKHV
jgi:hypothetical protein